MDEAKISKLDPYDPSLWCIDDSNAFHPSELENLVCTPEEKKRVEAYFAEVFEENAVQPAA